MISATLSLRSNTVSPSFLHDKRDVQFDLMCPAMNQSLVTAGREDDP